MLSRNTSASALPRAYPGLGASPSAPGGSTPADGSPGTRGGHMGYVAPKATRLGYSHTVLSTTGEIALPTWGHASGGAPASSSAGAGVLSAPTPEPAHDTGVLPAERVEWVSRVLNLVIAAVALLVLAPVCVLVALAVKITSAGPVFYTQTRVGLDRRWRNPTNAAPGERRVEDLGGQPFTILKFRSMSVNAEANGQAVWATKHDARVTPVGAVLRKTRLDEIPQLINVLRGEMNIVGPRPERPSIVVRLREDIPEYTQRLRVRPGITGWAQINHSYDACLEDVKEKVRYDLDYIGRQNLWFDLRIMCMTLPVMVFRKGAH